MRPIMACSANVSEHTQAWAWAICCLAEHEPFKQCEAHEDKAAGNTPFYLKKGTPSLIPPSHLLLV